MNKKTFILLLPVVLTFGCQTEDVVKQQDTSKELFHKTSSVKKAENHTIDKLRDKVNYLSKVEKKHVDFANTLEVEYVGFADARGLVTPINDGSGLDKSLINFIGPNDSFIDLMMVIETERKSENSYVTSYYDL